MLFYRQKVYLFVWIGLFINFVIHNFFSFCIVLNIYKVIKDRFNLNIILCKFKSTYPYDVSVILNRFNSLIDKKEINIWFSQGYKDFKKSNLSELIGAVLNRPAGKSFKTIKLTEIIIS
jgi:hypothetical protein